MNYREGRKPSTYYQGKKYVDTSWDFREANTKLLTHGFHNYPAMMIPQIARKLIEMYGQKGDTLFDPFCGTGTSLVEARVAGLNSHGFDINPLAVLIAKVKTTPVDLNDVLKSLKILEKNVVTNYLQLDLGQGLEVETPSFFNIEYWFSKDVIKCLALLKDGIDSVVNKFTCDTESSDIRDFFLVPFSSVVREASYTRNSEFKLYRMTKSQMENFNPDIWTLFKTKVQSNIEGMKDFLDVYDKDAFVEIDICNSTGEASLDDGSIDLVVTSPPYGDSKTTVAYGQFSRLSLQWMGYDEANKIDRQCMGGVPVNDLVCDISSPTLEAVVAEISQIDSRRSRDVLSFNYDLSLCIKELARVVKKGGFVCMVIGNRTVKGVQIPTDQIIVEIAQDYDFDHHQTIIRNIPNKRMPSKNSPTNVRGEKGTTMLKEGIVVLKKS